ncbi:asparagine synthetase B, partial [Acinetobacter baumannii]
GLLSVVFNGEIYNYLELMQELQRQGCVFRSHSDTEVILHAYRIWGEACVQRFNGMWAFALWDEREGKLFASRDRLGVKPF